MMINTARVLLGVHQDYHSGVRLSETIKVLEFPLG